MTLTKKILRVRRLLRIIPKVIDELDGMESAICELQNFRDGVNIKTKAIYDVVEKIGNLDDKLSRIEELGKMRPDVPKQEIKEMKNDRNGWQRLEVLAKFSNLVGKASEIESEWQKIQQSEHDEHFAFQILRGNNEKEYYYKKGIVDGIKWCVDRFC